MVKKEIGKILNRWGLQNIVWRALFWCHLDATGKLDAEHPNHVMLESRKFFADNAERIQNVADMFQDPLSRTVFLNQIEYRRTYDRKLARPYNMKDQYFPADLVKLEGGGEEVFVDCGAYIGDTVKRFLKVTKNRYKRIVCFEPDPYNAALLRRWAKSKKNIVVYERGTWSHRDTLFLSGDGSAGSRIVEESSKAKEIDVIALDDVPECQDVSFLKMDIEGAEWETLHGAMKIIENKRPILAVCIYHSDEDMLRIPEMIHEKWPDYRLYVRHHFFLPIETVLYAIPVNRK